MQSTSDQQDFAKYPPIAAAAPISLLPEQAASWAYPQPDMNDEEVAFCLVTGLLGRFYVSGHLNEMTEAQRRTGRRGRRGRQDPPRLHRRRPRALARRAPRLDRSVGRLGPHRDLRKTSSPSGAAAARPEPSCHFPHLAGRDVTVSTVFPVDLPEWKTAWDRVTGTLTVQAEGDLGARTLRLTTDSRSSLK